MNTDNIVQVPLLDNQYYKQEHPKKQIVLHHTAGGPNAKNVISGWKSNSDRIATAFVIDSEGVIHQCFSSKYWAHHLGTKEVNNTQLNKESIGIEICNWGILTENGGKFYTYTGKEIPAHEVEIMETPFKGSKYYHKYTQNQIAAVKELVVYMGTTYNIPIKYDPTMWELNRRALKGEKGLFTHVSYRKDKSDLSPQKELIKMLQTL